VKKILIGVVFVMALGVIGLGITGLVYGQFGAQRDITSSVSINPYPIQPYPTPTVDIQIPNDLDPTSRAMIDMMMSGSVPTPTPECRVEIADLSRGKTFTIKLTSDSSLWYAIDAKTNSVTTMLAPSINGLNSSLGNYNTYELIKKNTPNGSNIGTTAGVYTIQIIGSPTYDLIYSIYICPPLGK
jgi:hypothetical protein